jgi:hypothetical protein
MKVFLTARPAVLVTSSVELRVEQSVGVRKHLSVKLPVRLPVNVLWKLSARVQKHRRAATVPPRRAGVHRTVPSRTGVRIITYDDFRIIHSSGDGDGVYIIYSVREKQ